MLQYISFLLIVSHCFACEALNGGTCYYVDAQTGDDTANDGLSIGAPFRTFRNLNSYYSGDFKPAQYVGLSPGDVVYVNGQFNVEDHSLYEGGAGGSTDGGRHFFRCRGCDAGEGTSITVKSLDPSSPAVFDGPILAFSISQSDGTWIFESFIISNASGRGMIAREGGMMVIIRNIHIFNTDGVDNNNIAGLEIHSISALVEGSKFNDNFDRTAEDTNGSPTENSCNVVIFSAKNVTMKGNVIFNSPENESKYGCGVKYKHGTTDPLYGFFLFENNTVTRTRFCGLGSGSPRTTVKKNLFDDSSVVFKDWGGPTALVDMTVEGNVFQNCNQILNFYYVDSYSRYTDAGLSAVPVRIAAGNNLLFNEDAFNYGGELGAINLDTYGSDEEYDATVPNSFEIDQNCYFIPGANAVQFNAWSAENFSPTRGCLCDLSEWRAIGFDQNSVINQDPMFDQLTELPSVTGPCAGMGPGAGHIWPNGDSIPSANYIPIMATSPVVEPSASMADPSSAALPDSSGLSGSSSLGSGSSDSTASSQSDIDENGVSSIGTSFSLLFGLIILL